MPVSSGPRRRSASSPASISPTPVSREPRASAASRRTARSHGTIQMRGSGPVRLMALPAGTVRVQPDSICASVRGVPFSPCFTSTRSTRSSFRGSISGLGFAYCDFVRRNPRVDVAERRPAPTGHELRRPRAATTSEDAQLARHGRRSSRLTSGRSQIRRRHRAALRRPAAAGTAGAGRGSRYRPAPIRAR